MSTDITKLNEIKKKYLKALEENKELQRKADVFYKEAAACLTELQKECPHHLTYREDDYYSGGYDHKSRSVIKNICSFCDKVIKSYDDPNHSGSYQ